MKIAFISDIHANLPALEAVLADIDQIQADFIFCLGDLIGYNIWPNEVVEEIRKRRIPTIMGNHDEAQLFPFTHEDKNSNRGITREMLNDENHAYCVQLPRQLFFDFQTEEGNARIQLVHGSPKAINDYFTVDYPEEEALKFMEEANSHIILCGHTHKPYHRIITASDQTFRHVINVGSVGKPKDGNPKACYALMELKSEMSLSDKNMISIEFRRVAYDHEKAVQAVMDSPFPEAYAEALRNSK
ncbi:metallophosphoesterase family protein [Sediminitomix flava]|uniref:Putative phosphoesterase n=1 Tax=Sediminitomix flava TaxID=379075 RepID=A0A315ZBG9_SEDFL|nr:metallophosphoesterase family protein [Sediminitomix flava]PWJ42891.1 putative phosphoesterase [Sediminitomix flava]